MPSKKAQPQRSRWSQLVAEAKKDYTPPEPYLCDGLTPPVAITAPDTLERSLALANLVDKAGSVSGQDLEELVRALVGHEVFPQIWGLLRDEPIEVTIAFIGELNDHFNTGADEGAGEVPGGEQDS